MCVWAKIDDFKEKPSSIEILKVSISWINPSLIITVEVLLADSRLSFAKICERNKRQAVWIPSRWSALPHPAHIIFGDTATTNIQKATCNQEGCLHQTHLKDLVCSLDQPSFRSWLIRALRNEPCDRRHLSLLVRELQLELDVRRPASCSTMWAFRKVVIVRHH